MAIIVRRILFIIIFFLLTGVFFVQKANAASLTSVSDSISTSRPSAAAPLSADAINGVGQTQIFDNGSFFLASDSAVILKDPTADLGTSDVSLKVASMSATGVPSGTNRIVYFSNITGSAHHKGLALVTPITATHQIRLTPITTIPSGGTIIITFPGTGNNSASPSATGFSFNNEATTPTDVICFPTTACSGGKASNQSNTFTMTTGAAIAGGTAVYINIGCTAAAAGPCTAFQSRLINPTKTAAAGSSDSWRITIQTTDTPANGSVVLDSAIIRAATIESVQVQALVEPTITFSIAGLNNTDDYNTISGATNCGSEQSNSGINSTATFVNLGLLNNAQVNRAAQLLTVSTNGSTGYVITATTSGRFINPANGQWLLDGNGGSGLVGIDNPAPVAVPAVNVPVFGFSPCGTNVYNSPASIWGTIGGNTISANTAKISNPWNTGTNGYYATLTSYTGGPISADKTVVRYAAGVSGTTPAGIYSTIVTFVATATF